MSSNLKLEELVESRDWSSPDKVTLHFRVTGTSDDVAAKAFFEANAPAEHDGLTRGDYSCTPHTVDAVTDTGDWRFEVPYGKLITTVDLGSSYTFDTGGGTQHITQAIGTVGTYPPGSADFKGAIGVTSDSVEGVDITVPVYNWTETHRFYNSSVSTAYKHTLFYLTGKVNNAAFRGFAPGEVLFLGASGSQSDSEKWSITFRFAASPNRYNIAVGDIIVPAKKGWEYMWVQYKDAEGAESIVKTPATATVVQVYHEASLTGLNIGV